MRKIRFLKRTSKALQQFFLKWEMKEEQEVFHVNHYVIFHIFSCVLFFSKCTRRYICSSELVSSQRIFPHCKITTNNTCSKLSSLVVLHYSSGVYNAECKYYTQMDASSPHAFLVGRQDFARSKRQLGVHKCLLPDTHYTLDKKCSKIIQLYLTITVI